MTDTGIDEVADATVALVRSAWPDRPEVARQLAVAAIREFATKGFHATTTRDVASAVGLSPAAMYVHFRSKEALLFEIAMLGNQRALEVAWGSRSIADPVERLRLLVRDYTAFLAAHRDITRVVMRDYEALSEPHHREVSKLRRRTVAAVREAVDAGVALGVFDIADPASVVIAIFAMCVDVTNWFPTGELADPVLVGERYGEYAIRMVGGR